MDAPVVYPSSSAEHTVLHGAVLLRVNTYARAGFPHSNALRYSNSQNVVRPPCSLGNVINPICSNSLPINAMRMDSL